MCVCVRVCESWDGGEGQVPALFIFLSCPPDVPYRRALPCRQPVDTAGPGWVPACAPTCRGCTQSPFPRHVSFLFCPSAGPPQGLISMVVLWKVSAPRSTLWPNVVIRNSDKKRQDTRQEGGAQGPGAAAENV